MKDQLTVARNQSLHLHTFQPNNLNAHMEFLFHGTLLIKILTIRKFQKNFFLTFQELVFNTFPVLATPMQFPPNTKDARQPPPPNVDPTAYDLIMLEVDDILPSALTPLVLAPTVPEPICKMQTPALFTMAQSSPQPQSVNVANCARVKPLPSPTTSSSSSGELHLYIGSDASSPSVPAGPQSSSQELLLQGTSQVPQPPPLFSTAHITVSTSQPPTRPTSIPSRADEVATVEQSGHSTLETVVPNWA